MKYSIAGTVAALCLTSSASPCAPAPASFAIQITAPLGGTPTTLFLGKDGSGTGVTDVAQAASCSINANSQLLCDGKTMGANALGYVDMAAIGAVSGARAITDGFSVKDNQLHWASSKFATLPQVGATIMNEQGGEAKWGLWKSGATRGQVKLYSMLGCPGGSHDGLHEEVIIGTNKIVPL
ncbi:hypothetical protein LTS18_012648 [Coniosporium uncinatum]|uniref:Uncharacterized protein n=1 Tax=Coniosporium uncinatum TaxID=93489 RepID=A0ACC3CXA2_9PEZI|nr:hypothetical protein LTS18_012648 [Coniosporium uncinatum]